MKKLLKYYILILCCIIGVILFSGCSGSIPNDEKIKTDLNSTEFINVAKLYDNDSTKVLPVTEVAIIETQKENKNCRFTCNVIQENEHYKKETQLVISYIKSDDWYLDTYNEISATVVPVSGVPDVIIEKQASMRFYNSTTWEFTNITHNFNADKLTDNISVDCVEKCLNCDKMITFDNVTYQFNEAWKSERQSYLKETVTKRIWKCDELEGTTWQGRFGTGIRTLRINSIDTVNQTIDIDYGYSDLTHHEVCNYEIKNYSNSYSNGRPAQALIASLTYDFYDVEILENNIVYGGGLAKIAE